MLRYDPYAAIKKERLDLSTDPPLPHRAIYDVLGEPLAYRFLQTTANRAYRQ
jgi:hypothetical protein